MKIVTYHFIRKFNPWLPFFKYLSIDNFYKQLDYFEKTYGFVEFEDFISLCQNNFDARDFDRIRNKVLLTFDDAYREHFELVMPELKRRGIFGLFFIPTGMYQNKRALDVHKIYYLLGKYGGKKLIEIGNLIAKHFALKNLQALDILKYRQLDERDCIAEFKKLFNSFTDYNLREKFLNAISLELNEDEKKIFDELYMTEKELKIMYENNMLIGSHSINHYSLSQLNQREQERQIIESFEFLKKILGDFTPKLFCYPYGDAGSFTNFTQKTLENYGCDFSFSSEARDVMPRDLFYNRQAMPRYDCSSFSFGSPTFI